ncbi:MAG: glycoside hydrolase family 43 protein [Lachnospiraceae bacterium]|nr:glycoside hydrolase family 43 protein [Lachnospiraceae bacterium]
MAFGLASCSGVRDNNANNGGEEEVTDGYFGEICELSDKDITVTLSTDKKEYAPGEDINYTLSVKNDRTGYTISMVSVTSTNDDSLSESEGPKFKGVIEAGNEAVYNGVIVTGSDNPIKPEAPSKVALTGDVDTLTLRPYVKVKVGDTESTVRYIVDIVMFGKKIEISAEDKVDYKTVACHDPSIVVGEDKEGNKCYYIFGSHRSWAKSYDLQNWQSFSNNLTTDYAEILAEPAAWSAHGSSDYKVDGYMWAPDVIYNEAMGKWCMYLSVDGENWYSSIVLLTADSLEGDWTYEGMVVRSGFHSDEFYDETDVAEVTGETEYPERYNKGKKWGDYYPNNIDACVFYDDDGNLWMTYGSWSGGIFILAMDEETGFRDKSVTYGDTIHSDPYFGKKIAGGAYVSGEASYIQKIGDFYWLFMSYGGLEARGGYNVRVFRSTKPDGDYVDELGNTPYFDTWVQNYNLPIGVRLFGGYKWKSMTVGQVAQGHNSAFVDDDGKAYIVFHTRTTGGSEAHYVKVHQLFLNKNGWLVAAPYQTGGENLKTDDYSTSEVAGSYDVIMHELNIDYAALQAYRPVSIVLNEDGTITGSYEGTWTLEEGTPYINLVIDGVTYEGVTLLMNVEGTSISKMTFTALGDTSQVTLWGSKPLE